MLSFLFSSRKFFPVSRRFLQSKVKCNMIAQKALVLEEDMFSANFIYVVFLCDVARMHSSFQFPSLAFIHTLHIFQPPHALLWADCFPSSSCLNSHSLAWLNVPTVGVKWIQTVCNWYCNDRNSLINDLKRTNLRAYLFAMSNAMWRWKCGAELTTSIFQKNIIFWYSKPSCLHYIDSMDGQMKHVPCRHGQYCYLWTQANP